MDTKELLLTHNKDRELIVRCNELVERFIAERGLICYGGTAIDFALRAASDGREKIYDDAMLDFADYDVFTPNWLRDAYDMAATISTEFSKGDRPNTDIRIINGIHLRTLRVEFLSLFVADFSYCPPAVFELIPRGLYKTHHGHELPYVLAEAQVIDMHAALSGPWDDPPTEVYTHRALKDIGRFNKLIALVPPAPSDALKDAAKSHATTAPIEHPKAMCVGLTAHFLLLERAVAMGYKARTRGRVVVSSGRDGVERSDSPTITLEFDGPAPWPVELMTERPFEPTNQRLLDWIPKSARTKDLWLYEGGRTLYSHWGDGIVTCEAVQGTLMMLRAQALVGGLAAPVAKTMNNFLVCCYWDLLGACDFVTGLLAKDEKTPAEAAPFLLGTGAWPSIDAPNESPALIFSRAMTLANIADRREGAAETRGGAQSEVARVLGMRPPNLRWSANNFSQQSERFLSWKPSISAYLCDGRSISHADNAGKKDDAPMDKKDDEKAGA